MITCDTIGVKGVFTQNVTVSIHPKELIVNLYRVFGFSYENTTCEDGKLGVSIDEGYHTSDYVFHPYSDQSKERLEAYECLKKLESLYSD